MSRLNPGHVVLALALSVYACGQEPRMMLPEPDGGVEPDAAPGDAGDPPAPDSGAPDSAPDPDAGTTAACTASGPEVISLATDDGVRLEADLYTTGVRGGPAAVLLHMVPPFNDRRNYPPAFIDALVARGFTVLNLDRRGAGGSAGVPEEAYFGPGGALDAKAAYQRLLADPCAPDPGRVAFVGASNGTTSALDFTVLAERSPDLSVPGALVFLTGGPYTEAQNRIANHRALLDGMPILFVYSTEESAWSDALIPGEGSLWMFHEYADGQHGTDMFVVRPDAMARVADWLEGAI